MIPRGEGSSPGLAVCVRLRPHGHGQAGPEGLQREDSGTTAPGSLAWLQRFSLSPLKETAALGVVSHLHVCRDCDGARGGVVGIQLPVDGVQCLVFAV